MFHRKSVRLLSALVLLTAAPMLAFAASEPVVKTVLKPVQPAKAPAQPPAYKPGYAGSFLSGRFAKTQQDLDKASELADEALSASPQSENFVMEAIRVHVLAGNIGKAKKLVGKLTGEARKEPMIAMLRTLDAFEKHRYDDAALSLSDTADTGLLGIIKPAMLAWITMGKQEGKAPVPSLNAAIEKSGFFAPFLHYQQALMYDIAGDAPKALEHMEQAVSDPSSAPYRVVEMLVKLYVRQGQLDKAKKVVEAFNAANPDAVFTLKMPETGRGAVEEISDAKEGMAELFFTTASILFGEEISTETLAYLRLALHLRPNFPPAQFMLAHVYEQQKAHERAVLVYDSIRTGNVFYERGQLRKALNLEALGKVEEASALLDSWASSHPEDISALITKADMLREQKRYQDASSVYTQALLRVKKPENRHWPIFYTRGICYERTGQWDLAEKDFNTALALEPEQPDVLNYLAYSWLTMGKNLKKAREYLQIAVNARPEDAHIVDSMGWAHYIAGDFEQAVSYLEQAIEITPDDAAINDHLGDAYWRSGRVIEARYEWNRALRQKPDDKLKANLELKLKNGLPPFLRQRGTEQLAVPDAAPSSTFRESGTAPLTP